MHPENITEVLGRCVCECPLTHCSQEIEWSTFGGGLIVGAVVVALIFCILMWLSKGD